MRTTPSLFRAALLTAALVGPAMALTTAPAYAQAIRSHGDPQAEAFVQAETARVIAILGDRSLGVAQKKQAFRGQIDRVIDTPRVTRFVLGKYARSVSPAAYQQFSAAFRDYAARVYETRLNQYSGQRLQVTGSVARAPGDVLVSTQVVGGERPTQVMWRVLRTPSGWKAVDAQVAGIWLAVTQQQDFVSTLDNNGGNVEALARQLQSQTPALPRR